jgi:hypothetical protein
MFSKVGALAVVTAVTGLAVTAVGSTLSTSNRATAPEAAATSINGQADSTEKIGMTTYSWGRLVGDWTIHRDGSGEFQSSRQVGGFNDYVIVTKRLDAVAGRYQQLEALVRPAAPYEATGLQCGPRITDLPQGNLHWRREGLAHDLSFDYGCSSSEARQLLHQVAAADALVRDWAANAPVVDERKP